MQAIHSSQTKLRQLTKISLLGAIAALLTLFEIPLFFAPGFYKLDISEAVVLIGGFSMGPMAAAAIELIKILLNLLLNGTTTAGVGEVANLLIGCAFVMPAAWIYRRKKTFRGAAVGLIVGTVALVAAGALLNYYVLLPVYAVAFHMPIQALVDMGAAINPAIGNLWSFVLLAVVPFNLLKGIVCSLITCLLYKKVSHLLKA